MRTWSICQQYNIASWVVEHTVDVMSEEQTSQTYLTPPSVPRVPVFFLITPMLPHYRTVVVKGPLLNA
jgi:hypothetical protein